MTIPNLRNQTPSILVLGSYPAIIQSILDFDYVSGKDKPSIIGIIAAGKQFDRYFFGEKEVLIPVFSDLQKLPTKFQTQVNYVLNVTSGRRVFTSTKAALETLPNLLTLVVFAENVPEQFAIELGIIAKQKKVMLIGPASVGLVIPGVLKLGPVGGVDARQILESQLTTPGKVAVFSSSGGMTNELIRLVSQSGSKISFALSFGGERFPFLTPKDAALLAQKDPETHAIVYFGELGGEDEAEVAELLKTKQLTKPFVCYIAGSVAEIFPEAPQFGHAKAMAKKNSETAKSKYTMLKKSGAIATNSFGNFIKAIQKLDTKQDTVSSVSLDFLSKRHKALLTTTISGDRDGMASLLGEDLLPFIEKRDLASVIGSMLLGKKRISKELATAIDFAMKLLVDHGPYVSGAVNTIITARAGKDLVSSLASGLLTIGPRFGGAINQAADHWLTNVSQNIPASEFVEEYASQKKYILGIGHKKYRIDLPDPRVAAIIKLSDKLVTKKRFLTFAKEVEAITTAKKGNLILNVDGALAALLLDILSEKEEYTDTDLQKLVRNEFFNALFVLSRSIGFTAHYLDQKRLDEGLFRLPDEDALIITE